MGIEGSYDIKRKLSIAPTLPRKGKRTLVLTEVCSPFCGCGQEQEGEGEANGQAGLLSFVTPLVG
jgi:hypothetical protein